jgi:hypothetical protein
MGMAPDPQFHPVYRASEVMSRVLAGMGVASHPVSVAVGSNARAYKYAGGGKEVWVFWSRDNVDSAVINLNTGGKTTRVIGMFGEDLGTFVRRRPHRLA